MHIINTIISGFMFFILTIISSKFPNKRLFLITAINALLFGILYYFLQSNLEGFRNNIDSAFKDGKTYYYDTVPTTDKCDTGDKTEITFYYNHGTEEKHYDTSNNSYTCKKITIPIKPRLIRSLGYEGYQGYGRGYQAKEIKYDPVIKYIIKPLKIVDPSFNCPESLDYDAGKGKCFTPNYAAYRNSCTDYDKQNEACLTPEYDKNYAYYPYYTASYNDDYTFPKRYKCPHAFGQITIRYPGQRRNNDVYNCDLSGTRQLLNNNMVCPRGLRRRKNICR